jgi:catechol 2,3-dioxygenase-like lactoylglutathione lyase family enzyme
MTRATIESMCPFFIVRSVEASIAFYRDRLGFAVSHQEPAEAPFFAMLNRGGATLFVKSGQADPLPNPSRDPDLRWDAYLSTPDPDRLAAEFLASGTVFSAPLRDTHDGLRGFEVTDVDRYVLFFGRVR